jgi:hypothetical protein
MWINASCWFGFRSTQEGRLPGPLRTEAAKQVKWVQSYLQYVIAAAFFRAFAHTRFNAVSICAAGQLARCNLRFVGVELGLRIVSTFHSEQECAHLFGPNRSNRGTHPETSRHPDNSCPVIYLLPRCKAESRSLNPPPTELHF